MDQEDVLSQYTDLFVSQMRKHGVKETGLNVKEVRTTLSPPSASTNEMLTL